jgi:4-hydroxy-tetrahydrodipicolinate synthase
MVPEGTIVPLVTPFDDGDAVDENALDRLIGFVEQAGVHGVMATALTGEGPLLTVDETLAVWRVVAGSIGSRLPFIPTVVTTRTADAVYLAEQASLLGADALMTAPILPELYAGRSEREVIGYYEAVSRSTDLPVILFNYPSLTGVDITPALVERLSQIDRVAFVKESTGITSRVHAIHRRTGDRVDVICGAPTTALESFALGATRWITGIMNVVPRSAAQLYEVVIHVGDLPLARDIYYRQVLPISDVIEETTNPAGTIKAGLRIRGVPVGIPRAPGSDLTPEQIERLEAVIGEIAEREDETDRLLETRRSS